MADNNQIQENIDELKKILFIAKELSKKVDKSVAVVEGLKPEKTTPEKIEEYAKIAEAIITAITLIQPGLSALILGIGGMARVLKEAFDTPVDISGLIAMTAELESMPDKEVEQP